MLANILEIYTPIKAFINTIPFFPLLLIKDQLKNAITFFITRALNFPKVPLEVDFFKKVTLNMI